MTDQTPHKHENEETTDPDYNAWTGGISGVPPSSWAAIAQAVRDTLRGWPPQFAAFVIIACWAMMPGVELDRNRLTVALACAVFIWIDGLVGRFKKEDKKHGEEEKWEGERDLPPPEPGP